MKAAIKWFFAGLGIWIWNLFLMFVIVIGLSFVSTAFFNAAGFTLTGSYVDDSVALLQLVLGVLSLVLLWRYLKTIFM